MDTVISGGSALNYPDSVESSPRSRAGDPWDESFPAAAAKLRLMCSYGGRIVPRPTDNSLCYLGGETRIVAADRHATLADLSAQLSRSLLGGGLFTLKYQLPNEDLDSLISVTTDEDLENMVDEYDRLAAASNTTAGGGSTRSSRLRLFLFPSPSKPESAPSSMMYSLMDGSKSETWFVDALNGTMGVNGGLSSDAASVNCLLGLEDISSVRSRGGAAVAASAAEADHRRLLLPRPDSSGKLSRGNGQDVHSIPDSPMLDNSSSFGSASSAPSLSNLPPIRDDRPADPQTAGLEEHFGQMNLSAPVPVPVIPPSIPLPPATASIPTIISATENPKRIVPSDDRQLLQPKHTPVDAPISDSVSRPVYSQDRLVVPATDLKREPPASSDPSFQAPMPAAATDARYLLPLTQQEQPQQQQQQQFIHANHPQHHYAHPIPSYYQIPHSIQHSQQFNPQVPMYFLPVRANPTYNLQMQPNRGDPAPAPPKTPANPELQASQYMTTANPGFQQAQVVHMGPEYAGLGYQLMHQQHPAQSMVTMPSYCYEYADRAHGPQVYYTQSTSPPALPPQYQTMNAAAVMNPDLATQQQQQQQQQQQLQQQQLDEVKQTRAL